MKQTLASLMAFWALVAAPNLCRAGVLVACCDHAPKREASQEVSDGCCDEGESANLPQNRDCGSCVIVCDTIAKPPDGGQQAGMELPAAVADMVCFCIEPSDLQAPAFRAALPVSGIDLPFPHSDIPLLI